MGGYSLSVQYESHTYHDKKFPIILHTDLWGDMSIAARFPSGKCIVRLQQVDIHWHEAVEILRFLDGSAEVRINEDVLVGVPGDVIVVNSYRYRRYPFPAVIAICRLFVSPFAKRQDRLLLPTDIRFQLCEVSALHTTQGGGV